MTVPHVPDEAIRREVLDPARSFIVRAPAGSGKTELLVRRVLVLLGSVDEPEEILAVTFTRKATGEMRRRVLEALQRAAAGPADADDELLRLAQVALARDTARGWNLLAHPARLRIVTIDSLNRTLAAQNPVAAGGSGLQAQVDRPQEIYTDAALDVLQLVGEGGRLGSAAARLLGHLDNRVPRAADLISGMLGHRDQWLPLLGAGPDAAGETALRNRLEATLRQVVDDRLRSIAATVPEELYEELLALSGLAIEARGVALPPAADELAYRRAFWSALADTWLTKEGELRKTVTVAQGFPKTDPSRKARAVAMLGALAGCADVLAALATARALPEPCYSEGQWQALAALLTLLPAAAAALRLRFAAAGTTDYVELAGEALRVLAPGAAAERIDARLRHLLIDEFQDTSRTQHRLLDALTAEFVPGDGRSVFLVGDPMQSIYRFREAEVGLFMALAAGGPGRLGLAARTLAANFRSAPAVVDWVNHVFAALLPPVDDAASGRVAFAPATAVRHATPDDGVWLHAPESAASEAASIVALVAATLAAHPDESVGVLVRSRTHVVPVLAALEAAGIAHTAVELRGLADTSLANDLLALVRALTHPADRLAWLAVLRAPWCGLTLADLELLVGDAPTATVPELLGDGARWARLSPDGQQRLARVVAAFTTAGAAGQDLDLRDRVEGLWQALGGPACAGGELALADDLFAYLDGVDAGGDCSDALALAAQLRQQSVAGTGAHRVQVLTIHKAKGLEFDTVILPALGLGVRANERRPLLWREVPDADGVLLAPINAAGHAGDPLYELLWDLDEREGRAELDRLLYVACTRARRRLHLFGAPRDGKPAARSLLARLWHAVPRGWPAAASTTAAPAATGPDWIALPLRRLPSDWRAPPLPGALPLAATPPRTAATPPPFDWASDLARRVGIVVHGLLQAVAQGGSEAWPLARVATLAPLVRVRLRAAGVPDADLPGAERRVLAALRLTLGDADGRFVLSGQHAEADSEYRITWWDGERYRRLVIDRTFLAADGVRWIIDYKTGQHEGGDLDAFLASEAERYRAQLAAYREAFRALGAASVRVALYFPLLPRLYVVNDA